MFVLAIEKEKVKKKHGKVSSPQNSRREKGEILVDLIMRCPFRWIPKNVEFKFQFLG